MKILVNDNKKVIFCLFQNHCCPPDVRTYYIGFLYSQFIPDLYSFNTSRSEPDLVPLYILYFTYTEVNMIVADHLVEKSYRYAYYMHYSLIAKHKYIDIWHINFLGLLTILSSSFFDPCYWPHFVLRGSYLQHPFFIFWVLSA